MKITMLEAEQMLMDRPRAAARDILGPDATEAEVEADAKRALRRARGAGIRKLEL